MTTELDADRLKAHGVPVIPITTGRSCHLDASQVASGIKGLPLANLDLVFIENVGNLICPAEFPLGAHFNVVLLSVAEGSDKILKYPVMFYEADCVVITKVDLCPYVEVDPAQLTQDVLKMRPGIPVFTTSAKTNEGVQPWLAWIAAQCKTSVSEKEAVN
jgi:hydrogenase nickel incorporation protein HypB